MDVKKISELTEEMDKSIAALALELAAPIYDDVSKKWSTLRSRLKSLL